MNNINEEDSRNFARIITLISVLIIVVAAYFFINTPNAEKKPYEESKNDNHISIGGEFELENHDGIRESTSKYKGRNRMVYFGFTYCPDICPNALNTISDVLNTLEKYNIDVVPIFVTIDPKRDSSDILKKYLNYFHPSIIGYTGSEDEIKKVASDFKVYYRKVDESDHSNNYLVDHSSLIYILDKEGNYIKNFYSTSSSEDIVEYFRVNLKK